MTKQARSLRTQWEQAFRADLDPRITTATVAVALIAATHCNAANGEDIWPSVSTLAALTRLGESTVRKQLGLLCSLGWLVKTAAASGNRWHGDGSGRPAQYRLNLPNGATPVAPTEVKGCQPASTDSAKRCYENGVRALPEGSNGATARWTTRDRPEKDQQPRAGGREADRSDGTVWRVLREAADAAATWIADAEWTVDRCQLALGALDRDGTIRTDPLRFVRHYMSKRERRDLVRELRKGLPHDPTPTPPRFDRASVDASAVADPEHRARVVAEARARAAARKGGNRAAS
ncbi:helix-turn-helix domain-containing protein [Pseudonocardia halophobica]|uniref:helix-turn-helix domain-containing protein n=1 Tax=Pseudonocardia halophobica TaxID=29401 RepID=UPI003D8FF1FB